MRAVETVSRLARFERRGAGTDAERRAARWLAAELTAGGRDARIETFWCRPNWALAHMWHAALALAGSLVSLASPGVAVGLLLVALASVLADALLGTSLGRWLTVERASQNVLGASPPREGDPGKRVRVIITANYDAGRTGFVYGKMVRRPVARLRRITRGLTPGWMGWLTIVTVWLLVVAGLRLRGVLHGETAGVLQLPPTVALILAVAALLDVATSDYGPAAGDNASGVAVALALVRALDVAPARRIAVELLLQGAGEGGGIGLRKYLRTRRRSLSPSDAIVLGFAPCGAGRARWWVSDGPLIPLRYFFRLRRLCARIASEHAFVGAAAHRGRGVTPAFRARAAGLPAIALGCLDEHALVPRSHQPTDRPDAIDPSSLDATVQFGLLLVDAIDEVLAETGAEPARAGGS